MAGRTMITTKIRCECYKKSKSDNSTRLWIMIFDCRFRFQILADSMQTSPEGFAPSRRYPKANGQSLFLPEKQARNT